MARAHTGDSRDQIFVSYAHENADWIEKLDLDKDPGGTASASFWIDKDRIHASDRWTDEAQQALAGARAAVLLISSEFLASKAIIEHELPEITKRYRKGEISVVFVPIGEVSTEEVGEKLGIDDVRNVISIPPWNEPLPTVAERRGDIREKIVSAATEPKEVQNLRRNIPAKYHLRESLGTGLLGEVFTAHDRQLQRDVAVKLLRQTNRDNQFKESVRRIAGATDHSNILSVYGAYLDFNPPHYIRQYVDGRSLRTILDGGQRRSIDYVRQFLKVVGAAVSHAHSKNVDDLNIKPSNIIVANRQSPNREFFLSLNSYHEEDFFQDEESSGPRRDVLYLPLEYRKDGGRDEHDPRRADQYRLGLVAYEMLVGSARFQELGAPLRRRAFENHNWRWPALAMERDDCLEYLCGVVDQMVKADPEERYDSIDAVVADVERADMDVETVRDSYRRLMESDESQENFFRNFYINFFAKYPRSKKFFKKGKFGDLTKEGEVSKGWQRQFQVLKEAVLLLAVFDVFQEHRREPNILTRIVEEHAKRKIPAPLYGCFCDVLINTVLEQDPEARSQQAQLRRAWTNVIRPGIEYMKEKTEAIEMDEYMKEEETEREMLEQDEEA